MMAVIPFNGQGLSSDSHSFFENTSVRYFAFIEPELAVIFYSSQLVFFDLSGMCDMVIFYTFLNGH